MSLFSFKFSHFQLSQIQCSSLTNRLFARSVPRGYQPPPTSPLVEDVPVMQYKQYKPPSRFSHPSANNLPSFKHPSTGETSGKEQPLMVNTLIQVFGPDKGDEGKGISESEKQRLSTFVGEEGTSSEQNSPTPPSQLLNGQKRVTLNVLQLKFCFSRTFVPANQANSTANPKIAIVKAFAASNSSQISEAQLREELGKELEQSVSLILDELGKKDKAKHPVTSTQSVPTEELEKLEGEESEATTEKPLKEAENSVVSTREASNVQQASSTTTVAPLVVFPKTKEPVEVAPATSVTTAANEEEKKEEATTSETKKEQKEENEITITIETQTEENILETKSTTTIATAQIYKSAEKNEAETIQPVATTNAEETPTTPTPIKQETEEENKESLEKPTYPTEEEKGGVTIEGSMIFEKKTTSSTPEEVAFAEDETSITEAAPSAEEKAKTETTKTELTTTIQTNSENVQIISKEEEEEEIKEQQKLTTLNVGRDRELPGPGWQRTDFEEGQLWVQCKPPSIRALLWPWPTNRTFENGVLFAKDFHEESDCYAELDKDSGGGEARLDIGPGKCGLAGSKT
uniref:Uncharacterized protein n=1 Tax=Meloidogyne hapla TaxID=6305 RepID=A0A1I8BQ43_MELHA